MTKRILVTVAHPDDEAFGPGGTIAKYGSEGVEIHILSATRGESGQWDKASRPKADQPLAEKFKKNCKIHYIREEELKRSAMELGVSKVEFMDFIDGEICNNQYLQIADKIIKKIQEFRPQVIITLDRLGVSGHLDHIAISLITTFSFLKTPIPSKLYYEVMHQKHREEEKRLDDYFIYFPEGYGDQEITTRIDYTKYWQKKRNAMMQHQSQMKDVKEILKSLDNRPKIDYFILGKYRSIEVKLPEEDLFTGISG